MKKLMTYLTLVVILSISNVVSAEVTVTATAVGKKVKLAFHESSQNYTQQQLFSSGSQRVILKDKSGFTLFQESISTMNTPYKHYNLKKLPPGEYVFSIQDRLKVTLKPFTIVGENIELQKEVRVFKPTTSIKEKMITYSLLAFSEDALIRVTNASGKELYTEVIKNEDSVGKRFDFSQASQGIYTITTVIQNQTFREDIHI